MNTPAKSGQRARKPRAAQVAKRAAAAGKGVQIHPFPIDVRGQGCERKAKIGAIFEGPVPCKGRGAVLRDLNTALQDYCETICCKLFLHCPPNCPCKYRKATQLAFYRCNRKGELGILVPPLDVWNCSCEEG